MFSSRIGHIKWFSSLFTSLMAIQSVYSNSWTTPIRGSIAQNFRHPTFDDFNQTIVSTKRIRFLNRYRPTNFTGWIYHYYYEHDLSVPPCQATIVQFDAVPTNQCLEDVTKTQGSYLYQCRDGVPIRKNYESNTCDFNTLLNTVMMGKIDTCIPNQSESKLRIEYKSLHCSDSEIPPIPPENEFMVQRAYNQIQCRNPLSSLLGLRNRFCLSIQGDITVRSEFIDFPTIYTFPNSSTCDGAYIIGQIPQGCVSEPDPNTQSLSYMFILQSGPSEDTFKALSEDWFVRKANGVIGLMFFSVIAISTIIAMYEYVWGKRSIEH